ncbi:MAG: retropepsin-like aspartic protease [Steroidobacteraceae bacterium]
MTAPRRAGRSRRRFVADCGAAAAWLALQGLAPARAQRIDDRGVRTPAGMGAPAADRPTPIEPGARVPVAPAAPLPDVAPVAEADEGPLYAAPTRLDRVGRVMAPVMLDGRGPFRFIVDTGATRSAISPRLVQRLGMVAGSGAPVRVIGVTGDTIAPTVRVSRLEAGALRLENLDLPIVEPRVFAQADGILGVEGMSGKRLEIDFDADRVAIARSRGDRAPDGFLIVPVERHRGGILVVEARIGRVRGRALIDTGAERTLGNRELQRRLALDRRDGGDPGTLTRVYGATDAVQQGESVIAPEIRLGDATLDNLEVTFADLPVFRVWKLEQVPAMLIGMDLLGVVAQLNVDYRRAELQIRHRRR